VDLTIVSAYSEEETIRVWSHLDVALVFYDVVKVVPLIGRHSERSELWECAFDINR
jgi:hypothetical protein